MGEVIDGRQRFPINVRYPRDVLDSLENPRRLPVVTERRAQIMLGDVADLSIADGPPMIRSENFARLAGYVYVDIRNTDLQSAVTAMQRAVAEKVVLPAGYSIAWSGQFEYLERASATLRTVIPVTLVIIFVLLFLTFNSAADALPAMSTVPFALVGGFWLIWALGHAVSVATAVGFIALAGVAAEFGVVMLLYLKRARRHRLDGGAALTEDAALRRHPRRRRAARAAESNDRSRGPRWSHPDHARSWRRVGGDAAHRGSDGRRHGHRAALVNVRHPRCVVVAQASPSASRSPGV